MDKISPNNNNAQKVNSGLAPYTGTWGKHEIIHLLKRTMFGAKKDDVDYFNKKTLKGTVHELINPVALTDEFPVNDYDSIGINDVPPGKTWVAAPYNETDDGNRIHSFRRWSMGAFINQDRSVREKMLLFWHNHFATQTDLGHSNLIWNHHALLREQATGNFKELVRKVTLDCHMLRYLNGEENTKLAPNENYARELQELFCIGKGPAAKFEESDVKEAARVLTGWKVNNDTNVSYFKDEDHDTGDKYFSSFYSNKIIRGQSGPSAGQQELDELLDMIFANKETSLFICRRLYRWFVYYDIDREIEENIIVPLAKKLRENKFDITPVLELLFSSDHFFNPAISGAQIKSPLDFCIGFQREFNVQYAPDTNYLVNYSMWNQVIEQCALMGQVYADPPNVSGWPAYYQVPGFYELWINASTYPKRNEFASTMIEYGYNREGRFFAVDVIEFAKSFSGVNDPRIFIDQVLELLYRIPVSKESRDLLKKDTLLSGQAEDYYWTNAWNEYINHPEDNIAKNVVESRLKNLFRYIVNSPEYQLA